MDRPRQRYGSDDRPLQSGAIDIDHLSFAYRDDNLVLQDITLSVPSRSFVALVGHTGSGKSTLASLLMGYYPLTQGEIRLDGREIASLNHRVLRQGVAMVQQDPVVMADTFLANVTLGARCLRGAGLAGAGNGTAGRAGAQSERWAAYTSRRAGKYAVRRAKTAIGAGARAG
ncbi:Multidrug resistance-like ATP-binding protein mdlB [Salmonella enterica subsp. salamae]|uniref:Multidrug resistance-like ATP-binding protein mdlB n=1 Tax=Salmonella enterica subsp. salamae TaxID=59202 RepID=A0A6D2GAY5_SALER|nr:Multidrug resistance-like ATP-binding protein mdlB [Salmonella enterica subsp. salamae]